MRKLLLLVVLIGAAGASTYYYWQNAGPPPTNFRTAQVNRGELLVTISATGTVEPEEVIDVGAQVAGKIKSFGQDPRGNGRVIDYGSLVEEGTVLALIDDALYAADLGQASAQVESARASVIRAQADLEQFKAKLVQAERNWKRAQELGSSRALSATDYDSYEAAYETAKASVDVGQAAVTQAEKSVLQAEASAQRSRTNLGYCTIKSPVKGVIIDRRVNIGQTVVASLNAPSLFLIAKDLKKMQVWAAVNEADIGSIHPGQPVTFTVDAFPGEVFNGEVGKVRLNATMTQNVVTYVVEINTDNSSGRLLPYLTANVQFQVTRRPDVLMVPNAALRWMPSPQEMAPEIREQLASARGSGGGPGGSGSERGAAGGRGEAGSAAGGNRMAESGGSQRPPNPGGSRAPTSRPAERVGRLWVREGNFVRPIEVAAGLSDGTMTEVQGETIEEGTEIVLGVESRGEDSAGGTTNPFTPRMTRGGRRM